MTDAIIVMMAVSKKTNEEETDRRAVSFPV